MKELALWGLVVVSIFSAFCTLIIQANADVDLQRAARIATARRGNPVRRASFTLALLGWVNIALWTMVAFAMDEWRLAVIWVPFIAGFLGKVLNSGQKDGQ